MTAWAKGVVHRDGPANLYGDVCMLSI